MNKDNWEHKSIGMRCSTCMWYVSYRCRKNAPTMNGYPAVYPTDFCGNHKLDKHTMAVQEKEQEMAKERESMRNTLMQKEMIKQD